VPTSPLPRSSRWISLAAAVGLVVLALPAPGRAAGASAEVEGGLAWNGYNDVRIPGAGGTRFSLVDDLASERAPVFRARLGLTLGERHALLATWAPVRLEARGRLPRDVLFAGERFDAGSPVLARYRFDSYRLTYRYGLVRAGALDLDLGATAFVRDAGVSVQGARYAEKTNVGFVPLLSFRLAWRFAPPVALVVDGDALAAPQGRAEDVLFALELLVRERVAVRAGYRLIEGGADNDEVYNFALVHHAVVGLRVGL
jgi:hypothetical protein